MKKLFKIGMVLACTISGFVLACAQISDPLKDGYVPNKETALKIAEAIWLPVFGNIIYNSRPFVVELKDGKIWVVQGTLHEQKGGVPYIEIQKSDCKILKMYHGK